MQQAYASRETARAEAESAFKRFILEELQAFECSPEAEGFRVALLEPMLRRYDALCAQGSTHNAAMRGVFQEYRDMAAWMRQQGFTEQRGGRGSIWPQMTEDECAEYLRACGASNRRKAMGVFCVTACVAPLMLTAPANVLVGLGLCGMFGMMGLGIYLLVSSGKPARAKEIKAGRFSLGRALRQKLVALADATAAKARKRKAIGIALLVSCVAPLMLFAPMNVDALTGLGVSGMFLMMGGGIYELVMSALEPKAIRELLENEDR